MHCKLENERSNSKWQRGFCLTHLFLWRPFLPSRPRCSRGVACPWQRTRTRPSPARCPSQVRAVEPTLVELEPEKKMIRNQLNFPLRYFLKWTSVQFDGLLFFCHLSDPSISPSFLVWTGYIGCKCLLYYFFYNSNLIYTDIPHCSII